jgi:hypothetical protein
VIEGHCWRCILKDPYKQRRLDLEASARKAAAQVAKDGWGALYADSNLEQKDTDMELWNGAVDNAIDAFLTYIGDPYDCDARLAEYIIDKCTDHPAVVSFLYGGFEDHGWERCLAFFVLAYETVKDALLQTIDEEVT